MSSNAVHHPRDLDLPAWGPYSKRYAGCSHIPETHSGCRLDLSVFPGWYQGRLEVPHVAWDSGYAAWQAAGDGSFHAFLHDLPGPEGLTVETSYGKPGDGASGRVVRIRLVNGSGHRQSLCAHLVLGCQYPSPRPTGHSSPLVARPMILPAQAGTWVDARDAIGHEQGDPDSADGVLVPDGWAWHEVLEDACVDGGCCRFGPGDAATYRIGEVAGRLWARVRSEGPDGCRISLEGRDLTVSSAAWHWLPVPWKGGDIQFRHLGGGSCLMDVIAAMEEGPPSLVQRRWQPEPSIDAGPVEDSLELRWPDLATSYGLRWFGRSLVRQWFCEGLDDLMRRGNHITPIMRGSGEGHWLTVRLGPFHIDDGESVDAFAYICEGGRDEVRARLAEASPTRLRDWHQAAASRAWRPQGEDRSDRAAELLAATLCTNVVFPIYTGRGYVRHHCPGKAWDSLYTWDSGFIALGLLEVAPARAAEVIRQYLMPEGGSAWLHHGSPLPIQILATAELWNRTRDTTLLGRLYPGLRRMHRFLAGREGGSHTVLASGLLATWRHFYNSGGWDDYPAQVQTHSAGLTGRTAPMVNTCHAISSARILVQFARILGYQDDIAEYEQDARGFAAAVQAHGWDESEGWFGYVVHDHAGVPEGLLRHSSGCNANRGLDGCYPLFAGVCTPAQTSRLLGHLSDPACLWTEMGFSTVDRSAPYFRDDGYWNGAVWLPHCWLFWKALLDLDAGDLAWRLADRVLNAWGREFADTGRTWEKMIIATGRGSGWHHFGGLSSPYLNWYMAMRHPGRLSGGLALWILDETQADAGGWRGRLRVSASGHRCAAWVCLPADAVAATWCGSAIPAVRRGSVWEVSLPAGEDGDLAISAVDARAPSS